jgi:hypothetical protein
LSRHKAARGIEWRELGPEVDVNPLAIRRSGEIDRGAYQASSESLSPIRRIDGRIEQEGMRAAVGGDVDEPDECTVIKRTYEPETARQDICERPRYVLCP